jgi:hypothetical protein
MDERIRSISAPPPNKLYLNETFKNFLNQKFSALVEVLAELQNELQNLRAYSEGTRRLPGFAASLQLQDTLESLRRVDSLQANALSEMRSSISELESQVNGDDDVPDESNLCNRLVALEGRVEELEEDMQQVCEECFEVEDSEGEDTLLRRVEKLEDGEEAPVFGNEDEEDTEIFQPSFAHTHGPSTPEVLPAHLVSVFEKLFGEQQVAEAAASSGAALPEKTPLIARFPSTIDRRGQAGEPRPPVYELVSGRVAREDMINHPDTVYGLRNAQVRYRFHDGEFQIKWTPTSEFKTSYNGFVSHGAELEALTREYFRVDTSEPAPGAVVTFDRALAHMKTSATIVYGNLKNSRIYRMVDGRLKVMSLLSEAWLAADLDTQRDKGFEAQWRRMNDANPDGTEVKSELQKRVESFLGGAPKAANTVKVSISADTHGRPKPGATVSWDEARLDMLDHPEARYSTPASEGMLYRIANARIEWWTAASRSWMDSHFNRTCDPDSIKWTRQKDEPGTAVVLGR